MVDTEDAGTWVVKFRGAGQGPKALVAELIVGLLARALDLPVPEVALVDLDPAFGRTEKDPEIQDILAGSHGINVGLRFLEGAFNFDPGAASDLIPPDLPAQVVWLDALVLNPDRTHRNPNILLWERKPYLIDHGAALYFHHDWERVSADRATAPFQQLEHHVMLRQAEELEEMDRILAGRLDVARLREILEAVPDVLLATGEEDPSDLRSRYVDFLGRRLESPREWVRHAAETRARVLEAPVRRVEARR